MTSNIEQFYQDIGQAALAEAEDLAGKLVVYAEIEEDSVSADLLYVESAGKVRFRFCSGDLRDLLYAFWEAWRGVAGNEEWRTLAYVINDDGRFAMDIQYPDQLDEDEGLPERRPRVIAEHFDGMTVDYSRP